MQKPFHMFVAKMFRYIFLLSVSLKLSIWSYATWSWSYMSLFSTLLLVYMLLEPLSFIWFDLIIKLKSVAVIKSSKEEKVSIRENTQDIS